MRVFLDTSALSDVKIPQTSEQLANRRLAGDEFYLSVITHFQILWGYHAADLSPERYERLLEVAEIGISSLTRSDVEEAARMNPEKKDLLDALIAATVKRHDAEIWTADKDFLKFLPKDRTKFV